MRPPLWFVHGNCVYGAGPKDCWAAFSLRTFSYAWLPEDQKHARLANLAAAIEAVEADIQILRVDHGWDGVPRRSDGIQAGASSDQEPLRRYLDAQGERLRQLGASRPRVFLFVSLSEPQRDVATYLSNALQRHPSEWLDWLRKLLTQGERGLLGAAELERGRALAERARQRLAAYLRVRPLRCAELQWLVRRSFCRGLGEPPVERLHEPRALAFERNGQTLLAPQGDVLRWMDCVVERHGRCLRVESELGVSWQAQLVLGALPETVFFPGSGAELMFAPVESLPFGVDLSLNLRFLPNELALRIARRRIQDADQIASAEADSEQGVSDLGHRRSEQARDLLTHLQGANRPPLLRGTLALGLGATSEQKLEQRVEACRRAYGEIRLHRPLGDQLPLLWQHLPGQRTRVTGYDDTLTVEQVGAMMPTASHEAGAERGLRHVGAEHGFYLGHTLTGSTRPIAFNLREGSDNDRNTAILSVGALGSGKTTLDQKLKYEAFLLGAKVIDCDPKGDHRFHLLEEVAPHVERVTLQPDPALRGMLDPLRVAPEHLRHDAAVSFLCDLLPLRAEPSWETAVLAAVDAVIARAPDPTCLEVVRALDGGDEIDVQVAKTLEIYARTGLTQLGFADPAVKLPALGGAQVTYLPIRDLPGPEPGTPRSERSQSERAGEQIVRLIAMFAMQLMGKERERLKVFSFDEGWRLLGDPVGRSLLASLQRMGRSELAVPIISTQLVSDTLLGQRASIENLIGATFAFGMRSEAEAGRALALLGLDPEDAAMKASLLGFDAGRCLFRDHRGRVEAIQVDVVLPALLRAFSTTPAAA